METDINKKIRLLSIDKDKTTFTFIENNIKLQKITLNIGYELVANRHFKRDIPSEAQVEYAINDIEDALMSRKELVNQNQDLLCNDQILSDIISKQGETKSDFTREEIENLFSKYAYVSLGDPVSRIQSDIEPNDYAYILILREITHHLNFKHIKLER